jgi:hypothetical protein
MEPVYSEPTGSSSNLLLIERYPVQCAVGDLCVFYRNPSALRLVR